MLNFHSSLIPDFPGFLGNVVQKQEKERGKLGQEMKKESHGVARERQRNFKLGSE